MSDQGDIQAALTRVHDSVNKLHNLINLWENNRRAAAKEEPQWTTSNYVQFVGAKRKFRVTSAETVLYSTNIREITAEVLMGSEVPPTWFEGRKDVEIAVDGMKPVRGVVTNINDLVFSRDDHGPRTLELEIDVAS
jgi:hypothetical protein